VASIGHLAVGLAAASYSPGLKTARWSAIAAWSALSLLPDADVIGFSFGVEYGEPWGHRGATHSLTFSLALGLAIGLATSRLTARPWRTALLASCVLCSHGLLDAMTYGGIGPALLWPFDSTRYLSPWQPIAAAPIGLAFLSPRGLWIAATETLLFAPLIVFAIRRLLHRDRRAEQAVHHAAERRPRYGARMSLVAVWAVAAWLIASGDPARDAIIARVVRDDTAYAKDFSEAVFRRVRPGQSAREVRTRLGDPYGEDWRYPPLDQPGCRAVRFENGRVVIALGADHCHTAGIELGMTPEAVIERLGAPPQNCLQYSWSPSDRLHRQRVVCSENDKIIVVSRQWR
jgi:inner membrane protein